MKKSLFVVCTLFFFAGCSKVTTPTIEGTVIDKVTKQPVENAWIMAVAKIATYNPGGKVVNSYLLNKPHTRTDKEGKFSIPSNKYGGLGAQFSQLRIDVYAPEGKRGALDIDMEPNTRPNNPVKQDAETIINPAASLNEKNLSVVIPVGEVGMTIEQTKEELKWLAGYCGDGRYFFAWPIVQNACDNQELEYVIGEQEKLQRHFVNPKTIDQIIDFLNNTRSFASFYKKNGKYEKALNYYLILYEFEKKRGRTGDLGEYEIQINELRKN